jgi:putative colanic acid biosynthesis acetyltransferase WcaF
MTLLVAVTERHVINLSQAPGHRAAWDKPTWVIAAWTFSELLFVTNPLQASSRLRAAVLRLFGAKIGPDVIIRPRVRVKFPWKLSVGARSWIGEGVWVHNQAEVAIGADSVVSQETLITTGTHAYRTDMALDTAPVRIEDGAWVTSRCIVLAGSTVGRSALVTPGTIVRGRVPDGVVFGRPDGEVIGNRFQPSADPSTIDPRSRSHYLDETVE